MQPVLVLFFEGRCMGGGAGTVVEAAWSVSGATSASCIDSIGFDSTGFDSIGIDSIDIEFSVHSCRMGLCVSKNIYDLSWSQTSSPSRQLESRLILWRGSKVRKGFQRGQCLAHLDRNFPCAKVTLCSWCESSPVAWSNVHWRKTHKYLSDTSIWAPLGFEGEEQEPAQLRASIWKGKCEGKNQEDANEAKNALRNG